MLDRSIPLLELVLKAQEAKLGLDHPHTLITLANLGSNYFREGRLVEGARLMEEAFRRAGGRPDALASLASFRAGLAMAYWLTGKHEHSIPLFEEILKQEEVKHGPHDPNTLVTLANLGVNYRDAGHPAEGARLLEEALRRARGRPDALAKLAWVPSDLAMAYDATGLFAKAEPLYRDGLEGARKSFGPDNPLTARAMALLGGHLLRQSKWSEAESVLRASLAIRERTQPNGWNTFYNRSQLGGTLLGQGRCAEAEPLILSGYEGMRARAATIPYPGRHFLTDAALRVVRLYEEWGEPAQATAWKARLGLSDLPVDPFAPAGN
jgi:tetratricopeptide (TPR) repeat protein